ncbi:hypothetical protein ACJQWK_02302 [Exserohilum turcicum]
MTAMHKTPPSPTRSSPDILRLPPRGAASQHVLAPAPGGYYWLRAEHDFRPDYSLRGTLNFRSRDRIHGPPSQTIAVLSKPVSVKARHRAASTSENQSPPSGA